MHIPKALFASSRVYLENALAHHYESGSAAAPAKQASTQPVGAVRRPLKIDGWLCANWRDDMTVRQSVFSVLPSALPSVSISPRSSLSTKKMGAPKKAPQDQRQRAKREKFTEKKGRKKKRLNPSFLIPTICLHVELIIPPHDDGILLDTLTHHHFGPEALDIFRLGCPHFGCTAVQYLITCSLSIPASHTSSRNGPLQDPPCLLAAAPLASYDFSKLIPMQTRLPLIL